MTLEPEQSMPPRLRWWQRFVRTVKRRAPTSCVWRWTQRFERHVCVEHATVTWSVGRYNVITGEVTRTMACDAWYDGRVARALWHREKEALGEPA